MGLSQRALAHSASGADGFHHTRPPIKYASRSRGLTQVYVRTQLGGQSLQNGDIAGSSAATRKPGAKVLAKSSSGGFRPRTVPTDPLDGYAIADLPPDAMLAEAAAFARKAAARTAAEHRLYKPPPKREETETEALFASMGAIQARTRHTDDPDDLNPYKGAERRRASPSAARRSSSRSRSSTARRATLPRPPPPTLGTPSPASRARRICTATARRT